jgi:putative FmdB family regulatory protein
MRLHDFECTHCGANFEELVRSGETGENVTCPQCGEKGARKLLSGFALGGRGVGGFSTTPSGGGCGGGGFS